MNSKEYLKQIATTEVIDCTNNDKAKKRIANIFPVGISTIEKDLEVLEIIKKHSFLFVEKGKLYVGRYADIELLIEEDDFQDKHEYELLKEVFEDEYQRSTRKN